MRCEICGYSGFLEKHHIHSKSLGGSNKKYNITNLCPNCHNEVHRGLIILEGKLRTTDGIKLIFHKKGEAPIIPNRELPEVYLF
jgi:5-methylcytosine-specific restriction endonuclease McrA